MVGSDHDAATLHHDPGCRTGELFKMFVSQEIAGSRLLNRHRVLMCCTATKIMNRVWQSGVEIQRYRNAAHDAVDATVRSINV